MRPGTTGRAVPALDVGEPPADLGGRVGLPVWPGASPSGSQTAPAGCRTRPSSGFRRHVPPLLLPERFQAEELAARPAEPGDHLLGHVLRRAGRLRRLLRCRRAGLRRGRRRPGSRLGRGLFSGSRLGRTGLDRGRLGVSEVDLVLQAETDLLEQHHALRCVHRAAWGAFVHALLAGGHCQGRVGRGWPTLTSVLADADVGAGRRGRGAPVSAVAEAAPATAQGASRWCADDLARLADNKRGK